MSTSISRPNHLRIGLISAAFLVGLGLVLAWFGFLYAPGPHDNDWPLLMWLAKNASWADPSPLVIGHYGMLQLLLVRMLLPVFGSTLVAAKILNIAATLLSCLIAGLIAQRLTRQPRSRIIAMSVAATSAAVFLSAQSEFADPLSTCAFLIALYLLLPTNAPAERQFRADVRFLVAGFCLGLSGLLRVHFQVFSLASIVIYTTLFGIKIDTRERFLVIVQFSRRYFLHIVLLILGFLIGISPSFYLNLKFHGTLFSPIAQSFVGQVLFGVNQYNMLETYDSHPFSEVIRHPRAYARFILFRVRKLPEPWEVIGLAALGLMWAKRTKRLVDGRFEVFLLVISAVYTLLFVCQSWAITPRLLFPLTFLLSIAGVVVLETFNNLIRPRWITLAVLLFIATSAPSVYSQTAIKLGQVRNMWRESEQLCRVLRQAGMNDAREAFVFAWERFTVDDPEMIAYYNFGFWNLLNERYRRERPNPYHELEDLERFSRFMEEQKVKFVVLTRGDEEHFPVIKPLIEQRSFRFGKYQFLQQLQDDFIFQYQDKSTKN